MLLMNGKWLCRCLGLLSALLVASCTSSSSPATPAPPPAPTLTSIALSPLNGIVARRRHSAADGHTGTYSNNTTATLPASGLTFASSNTGVVSVNSAGLVTVAANAAANATASIRATDSAAGLATSAANSTDHHGGRWV
jgi:hypothetical protein